MGKGNPIKRIVKTVSNPIKMVTNPLGSVGAIGDAVTGGGVTGAIMGSKTPPPNLAFGGDVGTSDIEKRSGIVRPEYASLLDNAGNLKDKYKLDPYAGEMMQKLKAEATGEGLSPWAKLQMEKQGLEEQDALAGAQRGQQQALGQAQAGLMQLGGMGGGARERLASRGARDLMMANQGVARQGMMDRMGIQGKDLERKQGLVDRLAKGELGAQEANLQQLVSDVKGRGTFDMDRYREQMSAWAAEKGAAAQRAAAGQAAAAAKPRGLMGAVSGVVGK